MKRLSRTATTNPLSLSPRVLTLLPERIAAGGSYFGLGLPGIHSSLVGIRYPTSMVDRYHSNDFGLRLVRARRAR